MCLCARPLAIAWTPAPQSLFTISPLFAGVIDVKWFINWVAPQQIENGGIYLARELQISSSRDRSSVARLPTDRRLARIVIINIIISLFGEWCDKNLFSLCWFTLFLYDLIVFGLVPHSIHLQYILKFAAEKCHRRSRGWCWPAHTIENILGWKQFKLNGIGIMIEFTQLTGTLLHLIHIGSVRSSYDIPNNIRLDASGRTNCITCTHRSHSSHSETQSRKIQLTHICIHSDRFGIVGMDTVWARSILSLVSWTNDWRCAQEFNSVQFDEIIFHLCLVAHFLSNQSREIFYFISQRNDSKFSRQSASS